jgi:predicted GNAT family acetyltransferase
MAAEVVDVPESNRYEIREDGTVLGYAEYTRTEHEISFTHTVVEPEYGGRGLAGQLIRFALDDARAHENTVLPFCPFVKAFIGKHREYVDLVPERQRGRFDLQ